MKIIVDRWPKPIPTTKFDYEATTDNYEPGDPIGYGSTEQEAREDLLQQFYGELKVSIKPGDTNYMPVASAYGKAICGNSYSFEGRTYYCTRPDKHTGPCAAHGPSDDIFAIWENTK